MSVNIIKWLNPTLTYQNLGWFVIFLHSHDLAYGYWKLLWKNGIRHTRNIILPGRLHSFETADPPTKKSTPIFSHKFRIKTPNQVGKILGEVAISFQ